MNCDCAFNIGVTHDVCQDYALSGQHIVSISDGCSGSQLSDFGSRILSVRAMDKMSEINTLHDFDENEVVLLARPSAKILNLPYSCLDATLLCAAKYNGATEGICYGDGVMAVKLTNGDTVVIRIEYTDHHPFYINYLYDKTGRFTNWKNNYNNRVVSYFVIKENNEIDVISEACGNNIRLRYGGIEVGVLRVQDYRVMIETVSPEVESIVLMSDGVESFYHTTSTGTSRHNEKIPLAEVLTELLSFKNYTGRFVQRRMNKFAKTCVKNEWHHSDDISMAAIYLGE